MIHLLLAGLVLAVAAVIYILVWHVNDDEDWDA